jgi:hypothetical protein
MTALTYSLKLIRDNDKTGQLEKIFVYYVNEMYRLMWNDKKSRYSMPVNDIYKQLNKYLGDESRLLSSVFFGITIKWAYAISGKHVPTKINETINHLRKIRQLNDEIVDVDEDVRLGILTYPYLYGLTVNGYKEHLAENIMKTWQGSTSHEINELNAERKNILRESGAFDSSAMLSINKEKYA